MTASKKAGGDEHFLPLTKLAEGFTQQKTQLGEEQGDWLVEVADTQYEIDGQVFSYLDEQWQLACEKYPLNVSGPQKAFGQMALLAQALQVAEEHQSGRVGMPEILDGWRRLKVCGLDEYPFECIGKAVIKEKTALIGSKDLAGRVLRESMSAMDLDAVTIDLDFEA